MAGNVAVRNIDSGLVPTSTVAGTLVADQSLTVSTSSQDMLQTSLNEITEYIWWTATGGNMRVTVDGSTPTSTNGHQVVAGNSGVWKKEMAQNAKWIREGGTDGVLHISELTH